MPIQFKNHFTSKLPADSILENTRRQVENAVFSYVNPIKTSNPKLLHVSDKLCAELGIKHSETKSNEFLEIVTGNKISKTSKPYAINYGGHQFGHWAGQLGDGRAINLGEIESDQRRWSLQLKGAGPTPYSRQGDGLAVLRSSIREYLCSEAMHHLNIPTTRALSLALTGDKVLRDIMYNGNTAYEQGAIVCRVSPSFLRFGNYEIFSVRNDITSLQTLVDYTIAEHFSYLGKPNRKSYVEFFREVVSKTLHLVLEWQRVGFVHGVMNTDNMSILGLTIDYGPYGWLEGFDLGWTPNTTDKQHRRYRYGNQPSIALWNLYQLANALYPLIEEAAPLEEVLESYKQNYLADSLKMMRKKLGLISNKQEDEKLIQNLESLLQKAETDMTLFFRELSNFSGKNSKDGFNIIQKAFYNSDELTKELKEEWNGWFDQYKNRLSFESASFEERKKLMHQTNPKYVLRNYMAQLAIEKAENGDYSLIDELYQLLKNPYEEQPDREKWYAKRPEWARHKIGCSMLSCSS